MSLITKNQLNSAIKVLKTLISFKADRDEVKIKLDKSEVADEKALRIVAETGLVSPIAAEDESIYVDDDDTVFVL